MAQDYRVCSRCVMDTSDPGIVFDEKGICNHCRDAEKMISEKGYREGESERELEQIIARVKEAGKGSKYDCILGMSGGVDSSYIAHVGSQLGLRILGVHVDAGWNSEVAVENIQKLCKALSIDLKTIEIDWPAMKELQRAYMFSGLPNLDVPQDHVFAIAVHRFSQEYGIKYVLHGGNLATESILPPAWGQDALDFVSLKDVYKKCGRGGDIFRAIPIFSYREYYQYKASMKPVRILNYVDYSKEKAISVLEKEYGWQYYGGKHFESVFTKFFQSYYLPEKFGYDKRRAHYSSLIVNGEMSRQEALDLLASKYAYDESEIMKDRDYIIERLDISSAEWEEIMKSPVKGYEDYKNWQPVKKIAMKLLGRG